MNIVILSRNPALYSTQSLFNAARKRGHFVRVLDHYYCDLKIANNKLEVFYEDEKIEHVDIIIPRIGAGVTAYGSAVVRQFQEMGVFSTLDHEALLRTRDKLSCLQLLASKGIGVPSTIISNNSFLINENLQKLKGFPVVIKLLSGTHGLGVIKADNSKTAESIIESFQKLKQKSIIQEYISESKGADLRIFIVDGKIEGVMMRQAQEGEFRANLHRGANAYVVPLTAEEERVAKKAANIMGLKVCGVDILRSNRGPLVLEVNASPGLEGIESITGNDIAQKIIIFAEKNASFKKNQKTGKN